MIRCLHGVQWSGANILVKSLSISCPTQFSRLFSRRTSSNQWYKTIKEEPEYQKLKEFYKDSRVHWKQPYEMSDSITDKLINLLPGKESHKRQVNWENYLHILRRMEKENQFKDWDEEEPFTHDQDRYRRDYVQLYSEENCYAYTQYKFASSYSVMMRLLQEIQNRVTGFKPIRILDFGSGPGAEIAAINQMYPTTQKQFTCIDINQTMNEICQYINSSSSIQYYQSMIQMIKNTTQKYDFIVCNNVLTELCSDKEKTSITILLYEFLADGGILCFSERGSRYGFHTIRNARKLLLSLYSNDASIQLISPCTHCMECPLKGNKNRWCYFKQQSCPMPNRATQNSVLSEPFSYVLFQKGPHMSPSYYKPNANRILLDPIRCDKHVIMDLCTHDGNYERRTYTKGKMQDRIEKYRAIRKSDFGGLLYDNPQEEEELLNAIKQLKQ